MPAEKKMENVQDVDPERELFILSVPTIADVPDKFDLPGKYFGVLLVCDARELEDAAIAKLADALLAGGMKYFCSWGGDCERVHDLVDDAILRGEYELEGSVIITMWFAEQSLDEALWQFIYVAFPASEYKADCRAGLVIAVGNSQLEDQIKRRLSDLDGLNRDVVGEDEDDD